jgi:hypothetical protein
MLRASYSYQLVKASAERKEVSFAPESVGASLRVSFIDLAARTEYTSISASYLLIADSINRYLTDLLSVADFASLSISKSASDSIGVTEITALSITAPQQDSIGISEELTKVVSYKRDFVDSPIISEVVSVTFDSVQDDFIAVSDAPAITPELNKDDSLSFSDAFTRTVSYHRDLADAFTIDDLANIGDLVKDTSLDKGNIFGVTESLSYSAQKAVADTLQMQESLSKSMASDLAEALSISDDLTFSTDLSVSDSTSISDSPVKSVTLSLTELLGVSESITVTLLISGRSAFNNDAFNAFAFNE